MAEGRGPVIDAIWSYATPPFTLPGKPAFELWQPMASFIAALPMPLPGLAILERPARVCRRGRASRPACVARRARRRRAAAASRKPPGVRRAWAPAPLPRSAGPFVISDGSARLDTSVHCPCRWRMPVHARPPRKGNARARAGPGHPARPRLPDAHGGHLPGPCLRRRALEHRAAWQDAGPSSRRRRRHRRPRRPALVGAQLRGIWHAAARPAGRQRIPDQQRADLRLDRSADARRVPGARVRRRS